MRFFEKQAISSYKGVGKLFRRMLSDPNFAPRTKDEYRALAAFADNLGTTKHKDLVKTLSDRHSGLKLYERIENQLHAKYKNSPFKKERIFADEMSEGAKEISKETKEMGSMIKEHAAGNRYWKGRIL